MSDFFNALAKQLKDDSTNMAGESAGETSGWIDTGSLRLNALVSGSIYGGISDNRIIGLAGEEATGKTFFNLSIQKNFLKNNPEAGVVQFDTEAAYFKEMLTERDIDAKRFIISEPVTVEDFRHTALNIIDNYMAQEKRPKLLMGLDSMGNLSTAKEIADMAEGKNTRDMTRSQVLKGAFRVLTLKLARAKIPMIVTNHVYDVIGSNYPQKMMSGGSGLKYAASTILFLSKSQDKDDTGHIGSFITVTTAKSRFTREKQKVKLRLSHHTGLDKYFGLLDIAEKYNIIKKVSTRYEMPDGTKVWGKNIAEEPEKYWTKDILARVDEACAKEFKYGKDEMPPVDDVGDEPEDNLDTEE